nr:hypothetical protein [Gemmata obscuriglobus]
MALVRDDQPELVLGQRASRRSRHSVWTLPTTTDGASPMLPPAGTAVPVRLFDRRGGPGDAL